MQIVELFSGIGSQTQALKNIGINHSSICCESEKWIHDIYQVMHGETPNLGDITKIDNLPDCDLLTYSFPCQDISILGNQNGLKKGSGTRSGLLWEVERLLIKKAKENKLPKILLLENVKQLASPKNIGDFNLWLDFLTSIGYHNIWNVINSKNYNIPQNRERTFVISSLEGEIEYPLKNLGLNKLENFMNPDEEVVSEFGECMFFRNEKMRGKIYKTINNTQSTNSTNRIYGKNSIIHALTTQGSHPGNFGAVLYSSELDNNLAFREKVRGLSLDEIYKLNLGFDIDTIRLATPREVFRLMGFCDSSYELVKNHMIKNKMSLNNFYHISGNSIVVQVLEDIFRTIYN